MLATNHRRRIGGYLNNNDHVSFTGVVALSDATEAKRRFNVSLGRFSVHVSAS